MLQLLDLDVEAHRTIVEQLPVEHLSALSRTCRHFRSCILEGPFAEKLWRQKYKQQVGQGLLSLHLAGVPYGLPPTAKYWRHLCHHSAAMDHVHWWRDGAEKIKLRAAEADNEAVQAGDNPGPPMMARLARSGQSALVIGHLLVVTGGILRDISLYVDIVIMNLNTLAFIKPRVYGQVPMTRFRHTGIVIKPDPTSKVGVMVNQVLEQNGIQCNAAQGSVVLLYGGYNTMGQEFGGDQFEAFWLSDDGLVAAWVCIKTSGHAPSARFHHTTTSFDDGKQLILYGGEGHEMIDGGENQPPYVYTFDVASLTWHRRQTFCTDPEHSPGVRSLHLSTVRVCPETGHEELIVLAGYCNNVLAPMHPHRLDLNTWQWVREPGLVAKPGPADAAALPTPRQRTASETVGNKWLLLMGGSPTQFLQGNFLDDVHRLHLPTLTWRAPPQVHGRPARAMRNIAGHSLDGLLAFGGCVPTTLGIMPVAKADPLLLGPPATLDLLLERNPAPVHAPAPLPHPLHPVPQGYHNLPIPQQALWQLYHEQMLAGQPDQGTSSGARHMTEEEFQQLVAQQRSMEAAYGLQHNQQLQQAGVGSEANRYYSRIHHEHEQMMAGEQSHDEEEDDSLEPTSEEGSLDSAAQSEAKRYMHHALNNQQGQGSPEQEPQQFGPSGSQEGSDSPVGAAASPESLPTSQQGQEEELVDADMRAQNLAAAAPWTLHHLQVHIIQQQQGQSISEPPRAAAGQAPPIPEDDRQLHDPWVSGMKHQHLGQQEGQGTGKGPRAGLLGQQPSALAPTEATWAHRQVSRPLLSQRRDSIIAQQQGQGSSSQPGADAGQQPSEQGAFAWAWDGSQEPYATKQSVRDQIIGQQQGQGGSGHARAFSDQLPSDAEAALAHQQLVHSAQQQERFSGSRDMHAADQYAAMVAANPHTQMHFFTDSQGNTSSRMGSNLPSALRQDSDGIFHPADIVHQAQRSEVDRQTLSNQYYSHVGDMVRRNLSDGQTWARQTLTAAAADADDHDAVARQDTAAAKLLMGQTTQELAAASEQAVSGGQRATAVAEPEAVANRPLEQVSRRRRRSIADGLQFLPANQSLVEAAQEAHAQGRVATPQARWGQPPYTPTAEQHHGNELLQSHDAASYLQSLRQARVGSQSVVLQPPHSAPNSRDNTFQGRFLQQHQQQLLSATQGLDIQADMSSQSPLVSMASQWAAVHHDPASPNNSQNQAAGSVSWTTPQGDTRSTRRRIDHVQMPLSNEQGSSTLPLLSARQGRGLEPLPHESVISRQTAHTARQQLVSVTGHLDAVRHTDYGQMLSLPPGQELHQHTSHARPAHLTRHPVPLGAYHSQLGQGSAPQEGGAQGNGPNVSGMQVGTDRPVYINGRQWHHEAQGQTTWVPGDWRATMHTYDRDQQLNWLTSLQEQAAAGTGNNTAAMRAQHLDARRPARQTHASLDSAAPAPSSDGRMGAPNAEEEAQPRGEEESDAAGAPLFLVNGPTIVTADGRFTAWRVPGSLPSHLAMSDSKVAVNNFWRHETLLSARHDASTQSAALAIDCCLSCSSQCPASMRRVFAPRDLFTDHKILRGETGRFYTHVEASNQFVMVPVQGSGPNSDHSESSGGSPPSLSNFQPTRDLSQPPPADQNEGPCLMQ